ncbi:E3 ubiquitin-protein ligase UPL1-like isoform X2 [Rutidosis leptorrhynchoides]|uniref:E3 ubiquitin-protein ligase UPL1-like isoform X2 n=1 Tax=Rutidosis leptorrhynchoides TaxID=125765 RepID=UPI003A999B7C
MKLRRRRATEVGDYHHWLKLFNHFDTFFEKYIKPRKDLQVEDDFLQSDPPFPREAVLQIFRVVRVIFDNCTNKHFYSSYELTCFKAKRCMQLRFVSL